MIKKSLLLLITIVGCADIPLEDEGGAAESELTQLTIDPAEYRCEPMSEAARAVAPPPPPAPIGGSHLPRVKPACPPGQVPYYREPERQMVRLGPPSSRTPTGSTEANAIAPLAGTYWYAGVMKPTESYNQNGVGGQILITNPAVYDQSDMVTAEMSIVYGSNYHLVEVGLRKFWDSFPRLMISQWSYGQFNDAAGFVRVHGTYAPGMPLSGYYGSAVKHFVRNDGGNWWVWFNDAWMGYFPGSIWNNSFTMGNMAHFYGEVYSAQSRVPPLTDMGNGQFSSMSGAAYMSELCMNSSEYVCYYLVGGQRIESNAAYYSLNYANGSYMKFGGNGGG